MRKNLITDLQEIATQFELGGRFVSADRYGRGHINDRFVVSVEKDHGKLRFILQRINRHVFRDPGRCCTISVESPSTWRRNRMIPVRALPWSQVMTECLFIKMKRAATGAPTGLSRAHAQSTSGKQVTGQGGRRDVRAVPKSGQRPPGTRLHETIRDFHNTPARYRQFHTAHAVDAHDRARHCIPEIEWALAHEQAAGSLLALQEAGEIPERVTHNDTKLNNVMFDKQSGKALCVIDLDTVMPGLALYDFVTWCAPQR